MKWSRLDIPASTVHAVLTRCRINRLTHVDRVTGEPPSPYAAANTTTPARSSTSTSPSSATSPTAAATGFVGRQQGARNKRATPGLPRGADYKPRTGKAFLHTVIDDHSRIAVAWFAER